PGIILVVLAFLFLFSPHWILDVFKWMLKLWPLLLILLGLRLIWMASRSSKSPQTGGTTDSSSSSQEEKDDQTG
ncbi:MAG: hypothetical protein ABH878_01870, partial [bacterium]